MLFVRSLSAPASSSARTTASCPFWAAVNSGVAPLFFARSLSAQRMEFVLQKEQQEAERKKIEAQGIADFQKIVSDGISPNLLKWKGIEATEKLAKSPNSKIVIMGNSKDSLPVILGQDDGIGSNRAQ